MFLKEINKCSQKVKGKNDRKLTMIRDIKKI